MKLSDKDKMEFDKYTKFLVLKATQIIIQSRSAEKTSTPSKAISEGHWFNLNINDIPSVLTATRRALNGETISYAKPLCVEISLMTPEKDIMVLETWCLSLLPEKCEPTDRVVQSIYNRMVILLKSLLSITRITPAYKISKRQGEDSYVFRYRIYTSKPETHSLGDGYKDVRIGQICTPIGTVQLSVAYRTKMLISPTQVGRNNTMMLKSDHFNGNGNNRRHLKMDVIADLTKPLPPGPFVSVPINRKAVDSLVPGVERLLALGKAKAAKLALRDEEIKNEIVEESNSLESKNGTPEPIKKVNGKKEVTLSATSAQFWSEAPTAPFAKGKGRPADDLMEFYQECKKSPPPLGPRQTPTFDEVNAMIKLYETKLPEYDALVDSFSDGCEN